ncbi:MAG: PAS domain S-box protein [Candidatus Heimdallarchaeota archaeon]
MPKKETNTSKNKTNRVAVSKEQKHDSSELGIKIEELEFALIQSERKQLGLFELTNDAIFIIDMNGFYIDVNQRAAETLGYNRQDIIGKNALDLIIVDEKDSAIKKLDDLRAGRILPIYNRTFKRRDGSVFRAEINAAVVQDDDGNPAYIQSAVRDISERIEAEEALERERKAYNLISEAMIYTESLKDFCDKCLSGLTQLLGFDGSTVRTYDKESRMLIPITAFDIKSETRPPNIDPHSIDDPNFIFSLTGRTKRVIVSTRFEDRVILAPFAKSLKKLNIQALISWPILDAKDDLLGTLQLVTYKYKDISEEDLVFFDTIAHMFTVAFERKRSEDSLRDSEEKYRSFAQNFQGIVYRIRTDNKPIFYNGAMEEISGYTSEELTSMSPKWIDIVHPDDQEMVKSEFIRLLTPQCVFIETEYRIIRKDGLIRWVHEIGQLICDERNEPIWIHGVIYDISERKRSEEIQTKQREISNSLAATSNLTEALSIVLEVTSEMDIVDSGSIYIVNENLSHRQFYLENQFILNPLTKYLKVWKKYSNKKEFMQ